MENDWTIKAFSICTDISLHCYLLLHLKIVER